MYRAIDTAYYLLKVAGDKQLEITNLKLQKLIYIANGYMLAIHDAPLINEAPQAWKYGPVIHSICQRHFVFFMVLVCGAVCCGCWLFCPSGGAWSGRS